MQYKYEVINVVVTWAYSDLTTIRTYCDVGWRFIGYSPDGSFVFFDRRWTLREI